MGVLRIHNLQVKLCTFPWQPSMCLFPVWEIIFTFKAYFSKSADGAQSSALTIHPAHVIAGQCSGSTQTPRHQAAADLFKSIFISLSPLKTNRQVCFWQELWSRLESVFLRRKVGIRKSPTFALPFERQGTSVPRRCHHGHICVVIAKKETCLVD